VTTTLRDPAVRSGLRLLGRTLLQYRRESMFSVASALLWMTVVVLTPYLTKLVIDRAIDGEKREMLLPLVGLVVAAGVL